MRFCLVCHTTSSDSRSDIRHTLHRQQLRHTQTQAGGYWPFPPDSTGHWLSLFNAPQSDTTQRMALQSTFSRREFHVSEATSDLTSVCCYVNAGLLFHCLLTTPPRLNPSSPLVRGSMERTYFEVQELREHPFVQTDFIPALSISKTHLLRSLEQLEQQHQDQHVGQTLRKGRHRHWRRYAFTSSIPFSQHSPQLMLLSSL